MVAQFDQHPFVPGLGADVHVGHARLAVLAVAAGVLEQVGDDPGQFDFIHQHVEIFRHGHGDLQFAVILHGIDARRHHAIEIHRREGDRIRARVVEELVDRGVELHDVGHHVIARDIVAHAHLGFEAQARQRGAQIVRDAGQHDRAVLLQLGEFLRHSVEADIHLADFTGHRFFVELAGGKVAVLHLVGGVGELFERTVDEARNHRGTGQRQRTRRDQPDEPGLAAGGREARAVHQQPVGVAVDGEAHPQASLAVDAARQNCAGAEATGQLFRQARAEGRLRQVFELVAGLARQNPHAFLVGHGLDERDAGNRIGMHQRGAAQVHQRCDLLRGLQGAGLEFEGAQRLQPRQNTADEQQREQEKRAPEKIQAHTRPRRSTALGGLQRCGAGGIRVDVILAFGAH